MIASSVVEYAGGKERAFLFEQWAADDARLLRRELEHSETVFADRIFEDLFLNHGEKVQR